MRKNSNLPFAPLALFCGHQNPRGERGIGNPAHPANRAIVDLDRAPRNADGRVEFESDFYILAPQDQARGNGALFHEVNNRGLKLAIRDFNNAPQSNDPNSAAEVGDGFLFRRGYTMVWCGWIWELVPGGDQLLIKPPPAKDDGRPIRGSPSRNVTGRSRNTAGATSPRATSSSDSGSCFRRTPTGLFVISRRPGRFSSFKLKFKVQDGVRWNACRNACLPECILVGAAAPSPRQYP